MADTDFEQTLTQARNVLPTDPARAHRLFQLVINSGSLNYELWAESALGLMQASFALYRRASDDRSRSRHRANLADDAVVFRLALNCVSCGKARLDLTAEYDQLRDQINEALPGLLP